MTAVFNTGEILLNQSNPNYSINNYYYLASILSILLLSSYLWNAVQTHRSAKILNISARNHYIRSFISKTFEVLVQGSFGYVICIHIAEISVSKNYEKNLIMANLDYLF